MKVKELSLLIISEDKGLRQQLAALVSGRYRSVTAAAPEQVTSLLASKSFDLVLAPILESTGGEETDVPRFERVLLEMAIECAEMSVNQVKRIIERDAMF